MVVMFSVTTSQSGPSLPTEMTRGLYEVTALNGWDWDNHQMFVHFIKYCCL